MLSRLFPSQQPVRKGSYNLGWWVLAVALAAVICRVILHIAGFALTRVYLRPIPLTIGYALAVFAGAYLLGVMQNQALKPQLRPRHWVLATVFSMGGIAAALLFVRLAGANGLDPIEWTIYRTLSRASGHIPIEMNSAEVSQEVLASEYGLLLAATTIARGVRGAVLGLAVGFAQYVVLRQYMKRSGWWIGGNVAGWSAAVVVWWEVEQRLASLYTWQISGPFHNDDNLIRIWWITSGMIGSLTAGIILGGITGMALFWLFRQKGTNHLYPEAQS